MEKNLKHKVKKLKNSFKRKGLFIALGLSVLLIVILFLGVIGWGIYKLDWQNDFIGKVAEIIPYPAAKVNSTYILYADYWKDYKAASKFYGQQEKANFPNIPSSDELKKIVLDGRLIEDVLVKQIASRYNIAVSQDEINAKLDEIIKNKGSQKDLEKFLADYYSLNLDEYKVYFIEPNLYYDKTNEAIVDDEAINGAAKKKIQEALSKLRNGEKFEDVVKQYSESEDAQAGGKTENFLRGELPKEIEDQLFAMKEGEDTDVLTMIDSFRIIKLEKKDTDKGVLTLKTILVKIKTLTDVLKEERDKAKIAIYIY